MNFHQTGALTVKRLALASLFTVLPLLRFYSAEADVTSEPLPGVIVEDVVASPALKGGTSTVRFRILNLGVDDISLRGILSEAARSSALVLQEPLGFRKDIEMFSIRREEELDLSTSHLSVELCDLRTDLVEGGYLNVQLIFTSGAISVEAHIHRSTGE